MPDSIRTDVRKRPTLRTEDRSDVDRFVPVPSGYAL